MAIFTVLDLTLIVDGLKAVVAVAESKAIAQAERIFMFVLRIYGMS
jgi:hypothetical protein